jgi:spore coat polysaccharide biosynthesis protein SpsF
VLETTGREATRPFEREHTTPFVWDQPERFMLGNVIWSTGFDLSASHRLTLDHAEDYALISAIFDALYRSEGAPFSVAAIVDYLDSHPAVKALNARHLGSSWVNGHAHELRTLAPGAGDASLAHP